MRQLINRLGFLTVFLDNLFLPGNFNFDFRVNYIFQFLFIGFTLLTLKKIRINLIYILILALALGLLILVPVVKQVPIFGYIKQSTLLLFNIIFSLLLINSYRGNITQIIKDYLSITYLICFVALVQFVFFLMQVKWGVDYSYLGFDMGNITLRNHRIQAWFQEPSFMVYALMPAIFIACARVFKITAIISLKKAIMLIIVILLSKSSIGFLGLLLSLMIVVFSIYPVLKKPLYLGLLIVSICITSIFIYRVPEVKFRVDDTVSLFFDKNVTGDEIDKINLSTYALYSNYRVTRKALSQSPMFGTGLGTYSYNYDLHINDEVPKSVLREHFRLNKDDGNSLLLRLIVETGIIGVFFFFFFFFNNRIKYTIGREKLFWAFNNGIFVLILLRLLRQGHYTMLGLILMFILFYLSNYENKKYI